MLIIQIAAGILLAGSCLILLPFIGIIVALLWGVFVFILAMAAIILVPWLMLDYLADSGVVPEFAKWIALPTLLFLSAGVKAILPSITNILLKIEPKAKATLSILSSFYLTALALVVCLFSANVSIFCWVTLGLLMVFFIIEAYQYRAQSHALQLAAPTGA